MTAGKELRDIFNKAKATHSQEQLGVSAAMGILAMQMTEVISQDIATMIEKEERTKLDGYILCLLRIMNKKIAFKCICEGYTRKDEKIPSDYIKLFSPETDNGVSK